MDNLRTMKNLLQKFNKKEIILLKNYLIINNSIKKVGSKSYLLVDLLLSEKNYSSKEMQLKLYNVQNYYAFNKLLNRLKSRALEIITFNLSIESNNYSKRNKVLIELRKKLLQADILQLKGFRENVVNIYKNVINNSKTFELYDLQIQALNSLQRLKSINSNMKLFIKTNEQIKYAEGCLSALKDSNSIFNDISNKISNLENNKFYKDDLKRALSLLEDYLNNYNSTTISYFLYTLKTEWNQINFNYIEAQKCLEKNKIILLRSKAAYTDNRFGNILINLANNCIYLHEFKKGVSFAIESKSYFKNLPLTLVIVDEILFYNYFYMNQFENCSSLLNINHKKIDSEIIKSKFYYFKACIDYVNKDYVSSIANLNESNEIERDRQGWNINKRILEIFNRIELNEFESLDFQMQNLEKYVKRISRGGIVKKRYLIILKVLFALVRSNYNFKMVYKKKEKYFKMLLSSDIDLKWEIKSPELINFNYWFDQKMLK